MVIFQQLLANKHYRLRDSKFGRAEIWFSSPTWQKKKKINPVQSKNRARPMAARLIKNKPRAEQEPRSAHGRAVKKIINRVQSKKPPSLRLRGLKKNKPSAKQETAQPTAARFNKQKITYPLTIATQGIAVYTVTNES